MNRPRLRAPNQRARHDAAPVDEPNWEPQPFSTSDQVLLCCFGLDQSAERSGNDLRRALVEAGFTSLSARKVINASVLICRTPHGSYRLRGPESIGCRSPH